MRQILVMLAVAAVAFWSGLRWQCRSNRTPQHGIQWQFSEAAARGDVAEMERLLKQGALVDAIPDYANGAVMGTPALQLASEACQPEAVKWLLAHGADPNRYISDTRPLGAAQFTARRAAETVAILQEHGAK